MGDGARHALLVDEERRDLVVFSGVEPKVVGGVRIPRRRWGLKQEFVDNGTHGDRSDFSLARRNNNLRFSFR